MCFVLHLVIFSGVFMLLFSFNCFWTRRFLLWMVQSVKPAQEEASGLEDDVSDILSFIFNMPQANVYLGPVICG